VKVGEVFVLGRTFRAAFVWSSLLIFILCAASLRTAAQDDTFAPTRQDSNAQQSSGQNPPAQAQSGSSSPSPAPTQDSPKQEPPKDQSQQDPSQIQTVVNETVDEVRRLPAQWFLGSYVPANEDLKPLTLRERRDVYVRQTYLTGASYLKRLVGAGVDQARGAPYDWGGGFGGYSKRFASHYGQFIIQNSIAAAGNAALGYEPRYDYCKCSGFWPRTRHAVIRNFVTYNSTEVEKRLQVPLYIGAFGAGAISAAAWKPDRENPWSSGGYSALSQAGLGALSNWLQEFALDIGRKLSPKARRTRGSFASPGTDPGTSTPVRP
jgi:hypothetical protein